MTGRQEIFQQAMNQGHSAAWDQLWERAIGFYRQALDEFPNHPQALVNLGLALYESQNYQEALRIYQRAVQAAPEDPLPMDKVAQLFERLGQLDYASKASLAAAELYVKNQDINRALENWQRVIRLEPDNMAANSRLAMVYERAGEKAKAVEAYLALAAILQERGDMEKAVRSVNRALQIMPNNDQAIQALALLRDFKTLPKPARKRGGTAPLRMAQVRLLDTPAGGSPEENGLDPITQGRQTALKELAGLLFQVSEEEQDSGERRGLHAIVSGDGTNARP
ncbi:MAG TPA: tetratricopeptide repeat protein, partial [Anaerolineales bacterium]|nr:tetratricopeptide repeat protein [Anaerolineales bacterium]